MCQFWGIKWLRYQRVISLKIQVGNINQRNKCTNITKTRTTPYHPKSDSMIDNFNHSLISMLRAYVEENQRDLDVHLSYMPMAYRSTAHERTGYSPKMLMLGNTPRFNV
jgi:hypothetical protein